ncbi:hypothetical protein [Nocardioides sp. WS12]|uniref:hypothetical protein n=1 Tax=Nocardioides sp. WS12 TaxID=2486272 RepID=UPI0015FA2B7B|nr:hypothetical protein [Nocardioides sp. WS12]
MSIHRELSALVRQAGVAVLADASEFRAAFDDFVLEGSATEGDANLLTDAIRLGALGRVIDQIRQGADPSLAIEAQGVRLAQQRGTQEAAGAQWALAVLTHARGDLDEQTLLARYRAPSDSIPRPTFLETPPTLQPTRPPPTMAPPVTPTPAPTIAPTIAPTVPPPATAAQRTEQSAPRVEVPLPTTTSARRKKSGRRFAVAAVIGVLGVGGAAAAVLLNVGDEPRVEADPPTDGPTEPDVSSVPSGTLMARTDVVPAKTSGQVLLAGRLGGVTVTALGPVDSVGSGDSAEVAAQGERLVAFTLAKGPCQNSGKCLPWQELGLMVVVEGKARPVPTGGPTFLASVPEDAAVELQYDAGDGFDQRVSLIDGTATGENIEVLARAKRTVTVGKTKPLRAGVETGGSRSSVQWEVEVDEAELFFFEKKLAVGRPDLAYLRIGVTYRDPDGKVHGFFAPELHLLGPGGKELERRNLGTADEPNVLFVVPADYTTGVLEVRGTRTTGCSVGGLRTSCTVTLPRTPFRVTFPD